MFILFKLWTHVWIFTEYCEPYAKGENGSNCPEESGDDEEVSDDDSQSSDEEVVGHADPLSADKPIQSVLHDYHSWICTLFTKYSNF